MKKLTRPTELDALTKARKAYRGTISQDEAWKSFGENGDRTKVREQLEEVQNDICAYCESSLEKNAHIDHFQPKLLNWKLTFDWDNLIVSCTNNDSCGNKKGKDFKPYWINPYSTDPRGMFKFYSDGQIKGTTDDANKIIKDFGLDCPRLEVKRKGILSTLQHTILSIADEPEALEYFLQEESEIFPTAYKQIINNTIGA